MTETALKNHINRAAIKKLGQHIRAVDPKFALEAFLKRATKSLSALEFTERTRQVAAGLREFLPESTNVALELIEACLPPPLPVGDGMFTNNFWLWPLSDFIRDYGADHWDHSIAACYRLTQCFTAEFAIRPLLKKWPEKTLAVLLDWSGDDSEHVRRLCSEGTRPRLPWATRLSLPRNEVFPILDALKCDESKYVQKSVANHLNDLGKDSPEWLTRTMKKWSKNDNDRTLWIVKHALRTQIKEGRPEALAVVGYKKAAISKLSLDLSKQNIKIGETIEASLQFKNAKNKIQPLLIDWVVHFARPNAQSYRKVFKGKEIALKENESFDWQKSFTFKALSTRSIHPGKHRIEIQINGQVLASKEFEVS